MAVRSYFFASASTSFLCFVWLFVWFKWIHDFSILFGFPIWKTVFLRSLRRFDRDFDPVWILFLDFDSVTSLIAISVLCDFSILRTPLVSISGCTRFASISGICFRHLCSFFFNRVSMIMVLDSCSLFLRFQNQVSCFWFVYAMSLSPINAVPVTGGPR